MEKQHDREQRIRFEADKWSDYFDAAINGEGQEYEDTLWWHVSDNHSLDIVEEFLGTTTPLSVCEPACGSGGTSLKLAERFSLEHVVLLDISPSAVAFAKSLVPDELADRCEVVQGDAFATDMAENCFDLVWNVGVIEHYLPDQILQMVDEMLRITKPGGTVIVAYPNRKSFAALKAALLRTWFGRTFLGWVAGYRFDTEILYGDNYLAKIISRHVGSPTILRYAGSALWVGAPTFLVKLEQKLFARSPFAFLTFLAIRKPNQN